MGRQAIVSFKTHQANRARVVAQLPVGLCNFEVLGIHHV